MDIHNVTTRFKNKGIADLPSPCFLIDSNQVKKNCEKLLDNAKTFNVDLRPHMKTHKTIELGILQTGNTKKSVVVSSLAEARFYAENDFSDILYGVPLGLDKIEYVFELNEKFPLANISVMIDNMIVAKEMINCSRKLNKPPFSAFLKVNCENGRAGVWWDSDESIRFARFLDKSDIPLKGFYAHCGNTYSSAGDVDKIKEIANLTAGRVLKFREKTGLTKIPVGIGSTPSCSVASDPNDPKLKNLLKINEFHPGNYVLYDLMQVSIGACKDEEIAGIVLSRVISIQQNAVIVDCGFTGLSKQGIGLEAYNKLFPVRKFVDGKFEEKITDVIIEGVSQEHGKLVGDGCKNLKIGDIVGILPWHSCAVGALHPWFFEINNGKCEDILVPVRGWL